MSNCRQAAIPITLTGLALSLGFSSTETLNEYGEREEFSEATKRARLLVTNDYEESMRTLKNPAGGIFGMKNLAGWADTQRVELSGGLMHLDLGRLSDEQLARVAQGEHPLAVLGTPALTLAAGMPHPTPERAVIADAEVIPDPPAPDPSTSDSK